LGTVFGDYHSFLFNPNVDFPFLAILVFNIFLFGGIYSILYGFVLAIKNKNSFLKEIKKWDLKIPGMIFLFILLIVAALSFIKPNLFFYFSIIGGMLIILPLIMITLKTVERCCLYKYVKVDNLVEGDWVAEDVFVDGKLICSSKDLELTKKQINKLKKNKVKKVLVKEGIPFVPSFFIGLVVSLVFGNLLVYIL